MIARALLIVAPLLIAAALSSAGRPALPATSAPPASPRHPESIRAEQAFFLALNHDPARRPDALRALTTAVLADPADGATNLWLGMTHLWAVAEGADADPAGLDHALLAQYFLRRAQHLRPDDSRIPSWLSAVTLRLSPLDPPAAAAADAELLAALEQDPTFHSVSVGIVRWESSPGSPAFQEGLAAMRAALAAAPDDPSALNNPRWPHNVEGFTLAMADYELKAGNRQRAAVLLTSIQHRPGYEDWPYRPLVEDRLDALHDLARRFADADPANDPPYVLGRASPVSCVICHHAAPGRR